ncbi:MAG: hypothetical protein OXD42_00490, partial [Rhodospirillaceae bacterium]|nr:hypothetical protein [Rhodospirillaceae bacterium]
MLRLNRITDYAVVVLTR